MREGERRIGKGKPQGGPHWLGHAEGDVVFVKVVGGEGVFGGLDGRADKEGRAAQHDGDIG